MEHAEVVPPDEQRDRWSRWTPRFSGRWVVVLDALSLSHITVQCGKPFRFRVWRSCSHLKKRRSSSLGLDYGIRKPICLLLQYTCRFKSLIESLPRFQRALLDPVMNLGPIKPQNSTSSYFTGLFPRSLPLVSNRRHVFVDAAHSPWASHTNRCPSAGNQYKKAALPVNCVLLA